MSKDNSAVEDFLSSLDTGENDPFNQGTEDNQFGSEPEDNSNQEPLEEKPLPFNKDPKVQKFIEKELEKRLKDFKQEPAKETKAVEEEDDYYVRLIGNDTPEKLAMIREAKARDERMLQMAEERAFNRLSEKEQEAFRAEQEAIEELENAFESIEENFEVDITSNNPQAKKTRQEFVSFIERIAPKDRNGEIIDYPDMLSAWDTFSEIQKSKQVPSRAKDLASRSMTRSNEATVQKDISHLGFDNLLEHLSSQ